MEYKENIPYKKDEVCLIEERFKREKEKPEHLQSTSCMIYCPCSRCKKHYL